jgi:hypothetical protein
MEEYTIKVAEDFNKSLGSRWKKIGPFSGEEFYESLLEPTYLAAKNAGKKLYIDLDGAEPYGSSFLGQSFGELLKNHGEDVRERIVFRTTIFKWVVDFINEKIWNQK